MQQSVINTPEKMKRTFIKNAIIVNEGRQVAGSVVIEGEKIAEIWVGDEGPVVPCDETIDATGCYLLPGVIDDHVHFRDPGLTQKADITSESRAAAASSGIFTDHGRGGNFDYGYAQYESANNHPGCTECKVRFNGREMFRQLFLLLRSYQ